jgi:hypothetical protein
MLRWIIRMVAITFASQLIAKYVTQRGPRPAR